MSSMRQHRFAWMACAGLLLAACENQMEPAQRAISDIEAALSTAAPDAAKLVPAELTDVRREFDDLRALFDRQDYGAVLKGAPSVMARAQHLKLAAEARKAQLSQALGQEWSVLAERLPEYMTAIQTRIDFLARPTNVKMAAGIDLDTARGSLSEDSSVWSKAQAAFATGNMDEAVATAKSLETSLRGQASTLRIGLKPPTGS